MACWISAGEFMTKGPCLTTRSPSGCPPTSANAQRRARLVPHAHSVIRAQHEAVVRAAGGQLLAAVPALTVDDVHEGVIAVRDGLLELGPRLHGEVHVHGRGARVHRGAHAEGLTDDDPDLHTVFLGPTDVLLL